ncbi:MAG: hypothetical protein HY674_01380 [Chloroflexi bacterium]|nr:hypothetical protein [Chloroflexota bacterium]
MKATFPLLWLAAGFVSGLLVAEAQPQTNSLALTNSVASTNVADTHLLSPMDRLLFRIVEDPVQAVAETVPVTPLQEIYFPVSRGAVEMILIDIRGKTLGQVKAELKAKLDADYYQNATIELRLQDRSQKGGQVLFFGAVRANSIPIAPGEQLTIFEGVTAAGPTEWANLKKVKLQRLNPVTRKMEIQTINVEEIKKGDLKNDIPLENGDRIEIPEALLRFF